MNSDTAQLTIDGKVFDLPVVVGSAGERAVDISKFRAETGYITLDSGFGNTGSCKSSICFINGEKGILRYRGIPIEVLAEKSNFLETVYLLMYGQLPKLAELKDFEGKISRDGILDEDLKRFFDGFPRHAHPMAILSSVVGALSTFYQDEDCEDPKVNELHCIRLLAKLPTIIGFSYKKSLGEPFIYPDPNRSYCENLLHMMFSRPHAEYQAPSVISEALDLLLILHAEHEQNCSTSTVRMVRSSKANIFSAISAGISALWGKRHGGANEEVLRMLMSIKEEGGDVGKFIELAKSKDNKTKLMGFGHRVYKNFDPRAKAIKGACDRILAKVSLGGESQQLLDIAKELEERALADSYFQDRNLYPNVDFYSGIMYYAMRIPLNIFTPMFVLGRLPGWLAHANEYDVEPGNRISRPRQIYTGPSEAKYLAIEDR